jgi:hypothetical protein
MEHMEDLLINSITNAGIAGNPDAIQQAMNNSMQQFYVGRSPAEIAAMTEMTQNFMTKIFNRISVPTETKLVNEREFLFYKLANEIDICPKLTSWERNQGEFLIKYKKHDPINILTKANKGLVLNLIKQLNNIGIFHGNIHKDNVVYNEYEGVKLTEFSGAQWIDQIDDQFLLNNPYGTPCLNILELLNLELRIIDDIFDVDEEDLKITDEIKIVDNHFHSSDEENVYY